ncbi:hypothetical protein JL721_3252 [Aureococcus anophagefferens]|nr:hypothetical protein JL721_3252 [Aureococcus anophagefferens]
MWVYLEADSATCNTETFGQGDPAGGYSKWCRCVGGEPTLRPSTQAPSHVPTILAPTASAPPTVSPPPSGLPTTAAPSAFSFWDCDSDPNCCAEQGGSCACDGDWASYGTNGNSWAGAPDPMWTTMHILDLKDADGAVECSTDFFGGDPAGGYEKCRCADGQPTAPPTPAFSCLCFEDDGDGCTVIGAPAPAPTFAYSADDCTAAQGYALDIVTRTCKPDVALYRSDMWDTSNSVGGQSDQYADLAQTTREYYGLTMYTRILRVMEKDIGEPVSSTASDMAQFGYLGQYLGLVTMANRVIVPVSGYGFEATQDEHEDDGGVFLGAGWVVLPIFPGGKIRNRTTLFGNEDFGLTTWTHVIDTAQFSGPLLAYAPQFWMRRLEEWCNQNEAYYAGEYDYSYPGDTCPREFYEYEPDACCVNPSVYDSFAYRGADWWPSTGGEFPGLEGIFEDYTDSGEDLPDSYEGPTYWKIPQINYPNYTDSELWQANARTYNADTYDRWLEVFAYAGESDDELEALFANFDTRFNGSYHMNTYGAYFDLGLTSLVYEDAMYMDIENGVSSDEYYEDVGTGDDLDPVETNIFYEWEGAEDRLWTRYYKTTYTPGRKERYANQPGENQTYYAAEPIDESEAPESLRDAEYTLPLWGRANYVNHERQENATFDYDDTTNKRGWNETDHWCWVCTDSSECELETRTLVLESTATLYYRWYRWRDQPAMKQLAYEYPEVYTEEILASMQKRVELMHEYWQEKDFIKKATKVNHKVELDYRMIIDIPDNIPDYGWVPISLAEIYEDSTGYGPGNSAGFQPNIW